METRSVCRGTPPCPVKLPLPCCGMVTHFNNSWILPEAGYCKAIRYCMRAVHCFQQQARLFLNGAICRVESDYEKRTGGRLRLIDRRFNVYLDSGVCPLQGRFRVCSRRVDMDSRHCRNPVGRWSRHLVSEVGLMGRWAIVAALVVLVAVMIKGQLDYNKLVQQAKGGS